MHLSEDGDSRGGALDGIYTELWWYTQGTDGDQRHVEIPSFDYEDVQVWHEGPQEVGA